MRGDYCYVDLELNPRVWMRLGVADLLRQEKGLHIGECCVRAPGGSQMPVVAEKRKRQPMLSQVA